MDDKQVASVVRGSTPRSFTEHTFLDGPGGIKNGHHQLSFAVATKSNLDWNGSFEDLQHPQHGVISSMSMLNSRL
jgi:hypothetical protein